MQPRLSFLCYLALAALTIIVFALHHEIHLPAPTFSYQHNTSNELHIISIESSILPMPRFLQAAHSATIETLPNGQLIALWFAGSHEGNTDVKIWQSKFDGTWQDATIAVEPKMLARELKQLITKVGNPVVYRDRNNVLHLFVVTVSIGGWSNSAVVHLRSYDYGNTWKYPEKIILSPLFNISNLVRTNAITLDNGFYLPIYTELHNKYPRLIRFDQNGQLIYVANTTHDNKYLQPAVIPQDKLTAYLYLRNAPDNKSHYIYRQDTYDGGLSWSTLQPTNLTNYDSSISGTKYGAYSLMVHNIGQNRKILAIDKSKNGINWQTWITLENDSANKSNSEFSYPAIKIDGHVMHIVYTWNRTHIKYVRISLF